ncbi:MAG: hypothetical protein JF593_00875 [Novosphingobium sp.]|nr:hypothetical protein [Novosphingobium sp.]
MTARRLLVIGLLLAIAALALVAVAPADALRAWLAAAFLWSGVPIGSLGLLMIIRLVGGRWGHAIQPWLEAGALTLPIAALAIVPVLAGMALLYPWFGRRADGFKGAWLAPLPFVLRTVLLFAGLGLALWALTTRRGSAVAVSSAGLLFLAPMLSLVLVDWIVSLDPEFHSSGFGLYGMAIQFTVAWMVAMSGLLRRQPEQTGALAALVITFALLWMYLAFTSYFIVWSGDLASVVGWYKARGTGGWGIVYLLCSLVELATFLVLLAPQARGSAFVLRAIAAAMVVGKALEAAWLVLPQAGPVRLGPVLLYALAGCALGLIVLASQALLLEWRVARRAPR